MKTLQLNEMENVQGGKWSVCQRAAFFGTLGMIGIGIVSGGVGLPGAVVGYGVTIAIACG